MSFLPATLPMGLSWSLPSSPSSGSGPGGLFAVIGGQSVIIDGGSLSGQAQISQRGTLSFNVVDENAAYAFTEGSAALLYDESGNLLLSRWVASSKRRRMSQSGLLYHALTCTDNAYLADKRLAATTYTSQTAQYIVNDLIAQYLAAEGVYGVRNLLSVNQSNVETDTTGFSAWGAGVTLTRDTTQYWQGLASLKTVCDGTAANQGFFCLAASTALVAGLSYTASLYLRGAGNVTLYAVQQSPAVVLASATVTLTTTWTRYSVPFVAPNPLVSTNYGLRVGTNSAQAVTYWADGLQIEPGSVANAWEQGQTTTITGSAVTIGSFTANYAQVSACLDAIAQKAQGYLWWIDEARRLYFTTASPNAPPVATIDDTIIERDTESVQHGNTQYRNTQYMLGGMAQTSSQTETRQGDGKATAFLMGYALSTSPTITLNAASQTVGILNVDTGKNWYWNQGSNVITQDASGTKLISTDTLSVTYVGQYPVVVTSSNGGSITTRQIREGGGTSGIVEAVAIDATLTTLTDAFAAAAGYLARYNQDTQTLTFLTTTAGFAPGQSVTANIPGMNLTSVPMLIESVTLSDNGPGGGEIAQLYYTVKAVQGPLAQGGARFWRSLALQAQQIQVDTINVGTSGLVAIAQSGAVALTWSVTGSATPFTVQFPHSTLYPAPTLYPGGTAGTSVAITWTKTQTGLNAIRDVLSGVGTTLDVGYFAWGTGTQGTPATATQLAAEAGRKAVTSIVNGGSVGEEIITGYIGPTDAVGTAITEVAFFAGPSASGTANSGVMLLYGLYSHTHTASEGIEVTADATIS